MVVGDTFKEPPPDCQGPASIRGWVGCLIGPEPFPTPPPPEEGFGRPKTLPPYPLRKGGKNQTGRGRFGGGVSLGGFPHPPTHPPPYRCGAQTFFESLPECQRERRPRWGQTGSGISPARMPIGRAGETPDPVWWGGVNLCLGPCFFMTYLH